MDEVIYEEFKVQATRNYLDRRMCRKTCVPCHEHQEIGHRREERLMDEDNLRKVWILRKLLHLWMSWLQWAAGSYERNQDQ